jgi:hypothetical protein
MALTNEIQLKKEDNKAPGDKGDIVNEADSA